MSAAPIVFVDPAEAIKQHDDLIRDFNGLPGLRDSNLLESALAAPQASWGGEYLLAFPWEMAAALLSHLIGNHPFADGNKRCALACALFFLERNGHPVRLTVGEAVDLPNRVARKEIDQAAVAEFLARRRA